MRIPNPFGGTPATIDDMNGNPLSGIANTSAKRAETYTPDATGAVLTGAFLKPRAVVLAATGIANNHFFWWKGSPRSGRRRSPSRQQL